MTQNTSPDDIQQAADSIWDTAQLDDDLFWNQLSQWVDTPGHQPSDILTLLNDLTVQCQGTYAGPYTLPPPPGQTSSGSVWTFSWWAIQSYAAMVSAGSMTAGLTYLAEEQNSAGAGTFRRDAVIDVFRLALGWYSGQQTSSNPAPVVNSKTGNWLNYVEAALSVSGTLAFAAPPVGPFIGAGLTGLGMLLGKFFPNTASAPDFTQLFAGLEEAFEEDEVQLAANGLEGDGSWLASIYDLIQANPDLSTSDIASWLQQNVQQQLTPKISGNTGTLQNLLTLVQFFELPGVIELTVYGISTYIALCRQQVVTDLALASVAQTEAQIDSSLDQLASSALDFTRYQQAVLGVAGGPQQSNFNWAAQLNSVLLRLGADRLSQITKPDGQSGGTEFPRGGTMYLMNYSFADKGDPSAQNLTDYEHYFVPTGGQPKPGWQEACLLNCITSRGWYQYVTSLAESLDSLYGGHFSCLNTWCSTMSTWAEMLPTFPPTWAPGVTGWTSQVPEGTVWVAGNQVRYAVAYANQQGVSPAGEWGPALTIGTQACPTIQLQPDPRGSAVVYWIFRQVMPAGAAQWNTTVVVGAPNTENGLSTFTDSDDTSLGSTPPPADAR